MNRKALGDPAVDDGELQPSGARLRHLVIRGPGP